MSVFNIIENQKKLIDGVMNIVKRPNSKDPEEHFESDALGAVGMLLLILLLTIWLMGFYGMYKIYKCKDIKTSGISFGLSLFGVPVGTIYWLGYIVIHQGEFLLKKC